MEDFEYGLNAEEPHGSLPEADGSPETVAVAMGEDPASGEDAANAQLEPAPEQDRPDGQPEEQPKKKRVSRRKADKAAESGALEGAGGASNPDASGEDGEPPPTGDAPSVGELPEAGQLEPDAGSGTAETLVVMGLAEPDEDDPPTGEPPQLEAPKPAVGNSPAGVGDAPEEQPAAPEQPRRTAPRPRVGRQADGHSPLLSLKLNDLDRDLTEQERQEWNDIYASMKCSVKSGMCRWWCALIRMEHSSR